MSRKSLRAKWSEIPFERKIAMFVAPIFVAVASALLIRLLSDGSEDTQLEVVDLVVGGGAIRDVGEPADPPFIDITVRNAGDLISIVKRARFTVRSFGTIEICDGGAGLDPSVQYDVELPVDPQPGETLDVKVSQQVPPNGADRFTFRLGVPGPDPPFDLYIYQLDVALFHDTEERALPVGTVLVSAPTLPNPFSLDPGEAQERDCFERNIATFNRMIQLEGVRSPQFTRDLLETT